MEESKPYSLQLLQRSEAPETPRNITPIHGTEGFKGGPRIRLRRIIKLTFQNIFQFGWFDQMQILQTREPKQKHFPILVKSNGIRLIPGQSLPTLIMEGVSAGAMCSLVLAAFYIQSSKVQSLLTQKVNNTSLTFMTSLTY